MRIFVVLFFALGLAAARKRASKSTLPRLLGIQINRCHPKMYTDSNIVGDKEMTADFDETIRFDPYENGTLTFFVVGTGPLSMDIRADKNVLEGLSGADNDDIGRGGWIVTKPFRVLKTVSETVIKLSITSEHIGTKKVTIYATTKNVEPPRPPSLDSLMVSSDEELAAGQTLTSENGNSTETSSLHDNGAAPTLGETSVTHRDNRGSNNGDSFSKGTTGLPYDSDATWTPDNAVVTQNDSDDVNHINPFDENTTRLPLPSSSMTLSREEVITESETTSPNAFNLTSDSFSATQKIGESEKNASVHRIIYEDFAPVHEILYGNLSNIKSNTLGIESISVNRVSKNVTDKYISKSNVYKIKIGKDENGFIVFNVFGEGEKIFAIESLTVRESIGRRMKVENGKVSVEYTSDKTKVDSDRILVKITNRDNKEELYYVIILHKAD